MASRKSATHLLALVLLAVLVISHWDQSANGTETTTSRPLRIKKGTKVTTNLPELPKSQKLKAALANLDDRKALSFDEALVAIETVIRELESAKQEQEDRFPVEHERSLKECQDYLSFYQRRDEDMASFRRIFQRITWLKKEAKHLAAYFDECARVQREHYENVKSGEEAKKKAEMEEKRRKFRESTKPPELPQSDELKAALVVLNGEEELGFDEALAAIKTVIRELVLAKQAQEGKLPIEHERLLNKYQEYLNLYQDRDQNSDSRKRVLQRIAWVKKEAEQLVAYFDECLRVQIQHYAHAN